MSPHVVISRQLDELEKPDHFPFYEAIVEHQIIGLFMASEINDDEFAYYCERFRRLAGREARIAA